MKLPVGSALVLLVFLCLKVNAQNIRTNINWEQFVHRQSLVWDSISTNYYTGIILGNGRLGTNIYKENDQAIRFDVGRTDVTDQRLHYPDGIFTESLISRPRLPIGRMLLLTQGKILSASMHLDIYNTQAKGVITTSPAIYKKDKFQMYPFTL